MKPILSAIFLILLPQLHAYELSLKQGWNLLGARETLFVSELSQHSCFQTLWIYREATWLDRNDAAIIGKGEGYWIKASTDCTIELQSFEERLSSEESEGLQTYVVTIYDHGLAVSGGHEMTGDTKTMIASLTKGFVGLTAAHLATQGKIDLDVPLGDYLGDSDTVALSRIDHGTEATLATCLNHVAGIYDHVVNSTAFAISALLNPNQSYPDSSAVTYLYDETGTTPGDYAYSNGGYVLAGLAIEETTGRNLSDMIQETIIDPLELSDTFYARNQTDDIQAGFGDISGSGSTIVDVTTWKTLDAGSAAGGMVSTMNDLVRYIHAVAHNDQAIMDSDVLAMLNTHQISAPDEDGDYRLGLVVDEASQSLSHEGRIPGYKSFLRGYTERPLSLAAHTAYTDGINEERLRDLVTALRSVLE